MANEISVTPNLRLANGNLTDTFQPGALSFNQNVPGLFKDLIALTAGSDTNLSTLIGATMLTTYGWAYFWNTDGTNYVQLGPDNGSGAIAPFCRMAKKGEPAHAFRLEPGITIRAKAHTGNCSIVVGIFND